VVDRIYTDDEKKTINDLQEIINNYDKQYIELAKIFTPEHEIQAKLLNDPHRKLMVDALFTIIENMPVRYYKEIK
jgi:hypothetical protein